VALLRYRKIAAESKRQPAESNRVRRGKASASLPSVVTKTKSKNSGSLDAVRFLCPRFNQWLSCLESLV